MIVAVPSFGRAGRVSTVDVFPFGVIVVPERQADSYHALQNLPDGWTIETVPDAEDGNISRKRDAIPRKYRGDDLVMLDDDYDYIGRHSAGVPLRLGAAGICHLLDEGFVLARDLGSPMWGVNVQVVPRFYREYSPFSLTSVALGPFQAFTADRPDTLLYDEDLWLKEDYDMSLRVLHRWHKLLRFNAYHYKVDHFNEAGGLVGHRKMDEEVRQLRALQRRWGSGVIRIELHRSVNPIVKVPLKGI